MYLQCPTDFSLLWHLTKRKKKQSKTNKKKKLNGKIFQSVYSFVVDFEWIHLEAAGGWTWAALLQGHFPCTSRRLLFWMCAPLSSSSILKKTKKNKTTPLIQKTTKPYFLMSNNKKIRKQKRLRFPLQLTPKRLPSFRRTTVRSTKKHKWL